MPQRPLLRSDAHEKLSQDGEPVLAPSRDPLQRLPPDISSASDRPRPSASPPVRISTPARDAIPPARTPSNPTRPPPPSPARHAFPLHPGDSAARPAPARPAPLSPVRMDNSSSPPPRSPFVNHPSPPLTLHPRPSFERAHTPSSTVSALRPSLGKSRPSLDKLRPSLDTRRPSLEPHQTSSPPAPLGVHFANPPVKAVSPPARGTVPFPVLPSPVSTRQPPPPPLSLTRDREIDTKIGGEAGMAGVGRRGFAAAARAAMLTTSLSPAHQRPGDAYRANVPRYLDTNTTLAHVMRGKSSFDPGTIRLTIPHSRHDSTFISEFSSDTIACLSFFHIPGLARI